MRNKRYKYYRIVHYLEEIDSIINTLLIKRKIAKYRLDGSDDDTVWFDLNTFDTFDKAKHIVITARRELLNERERLLSDNVIAKYNIHEPLKEQE